eukprot:10919410-Alexandrium_andersonii.AAC.1
MLQVEGHAGAYCSRRLWPFGFVPLSPPEGVSDRGPAQARKVLRRELRDMGGHGGLQRNAERRPGTVL